MKTKPDIALTLIEFLVAFAIFSTIALSVYGTFYSGMQINKRTKNFENFYRSIYWTFDIVQRDIDNMVRFNMSNPDNPQESFSGDATGFSLIVPSEAGFKRISYRLAEPNEAHIHKVQIGFHTSRNISLTTGHIQNQEHTNYLIRQEEIWGKNSSKEEILNRHIVSNSLKISYASLDKDSLEWKNEWTDDSFPIAIRLEMTFLAPENPKESVVIQKTIPIVLKINNTKNSDINQSSVLDLNNFLNQNTFPIGNFLKINQ